MTSDPSPAQRLRSAGGRTGGDEFGEPTRSGIRLQTFLTHEEIAEMIGSSRETVTRSLNVLKRERVVLVKNGYLAFGIVAH